MEQMDTGSGATAKKVVDKEKYSIQKRLPKHLPKRHNDVYITNQSNVKSQLKKCENILNSPGASEVYIHGLGAAVSRAINMALELKDKGLGTLELSTYTSTVEIIDDLEPKSEDASHDTNTRNNSAIHIKVFKVEQQL